MAMAKTQDWDEELDNEAGDDTEGEVVSAEELTAEAEVVEVEPEEEEVEDKPKPKGSHDKVFHFLDMCNRYEEREPRRLGPFLRERYQETMGTPAPRVPLAWIKQAVGYQLQAEDYADGGRPVPERVQARMRSLHENIAWFVEHHKNDPVEPEAPEAKAKPAKKAEKPEKKPAGPKMSIADAVEAVFKAKGPDASLEDLVAAAKVAKPDTKFSDQHRLYYRNLWLKKGRCRK